jgi:hypothetical protein
VRNCRPRQWQQQIITCFWGIWAALLAVHYEAHRLQWDIPLEGRCQADAHYTERFGNTYAIRPALNSFPAAWLHRRRHDDDGGATYFIKVCKINGPATPCHQISFVIRAKPPKNRGFGCGTDRMEHSGFPANASCGLLNSTVNSHIRDAKELVL